MKRSLVRSGRALLASLAVVGLVGCQGGPSSESSQREVIANTTQALPDDSAWTSFPNSEARRYYAGVELGDGSVLVCGGSSSTKKYVLTCNRLSFDGALRSQSFPLPEARLYGTLSLVPPNRVLLAGGTDENGAELGARLSTPFPWTDNANIWSAPETGTVSPTPRTIHTATRLDHQIALIGGSAGAQQVSSIDVRSDDGGWTRVQLSSGLVTRAEHTATLLQSQPGSPARVLVLGGYSGAQGGYLSSGFIFSLPDVITPIADMPEARKGHTATLLDDGSVLVAGGQGQGNAYLPTAWRYYPDQDRWLNAGTIVPRKSHAAARIGTDVIIAGGVAPNASGIGEAGLGGSADKVQNPNIVQRYNPAAPAGHEWSAAPKLNRGRAAFQLFSLDAAHLLAVGGTNDELGTLSTSEVFTAINLGAPAIDSSNCLSGYLADGVCCDAPCAGDCHWCSDPTAPGICQVLDGLAPPGQGCGESHLQCSKGTCETRCDGSHPCELGYFCTSEGKCAALLPRSATCHSDHECDGGRPCVDGVCCDSPCSGSCEACNLPHQEGYCAPLPANQMPHEGHPKCDGTVDPICGASCDGSTTDRCVFKSDHVSCGAAACTSEGYQPARTCDGKGTCEMEPVRSCGVYACDEQRGGCMDSCQDDSQCVGEGYHCRAQRCTRCDEAACNLQGYRCDTTADLCPDRCEHSADCAGGFYCHPLDHRCVEAVPFPAAALPACAITRAPSRSRASAYVLASLLCAMAVRRRRRSAHRRAS